MNYLLNCIIKYPKTLKNASAFVKKMRTKASNLEVVWRNNRQNYMIFALSVLAFRVTVDYICVHYVQITLK